MRVRKAAVESVLSFPPEGVLPILIQALYDPANAWKRNSAYECLVKAGPAVLPFVYDHLVDEDLDVKLALISLLGEIPSRNSAPHLIYYLSHDNINIVSAAISSLGRLKDAGNLPVLVDLFQRQDLGPAVFPAGHHRGEIDSDAPQRARLGGLSRRRRQNAGDTRGPADQGTGLKILEFILGLTRRRICRPQGEANAIRACIACSTARR